MFSDVDMVRELGRLPDKTKLPDAVIEPHLASAGAELKRWIGVYIDTEDTDKKAACIEAECCLCMYFLVPVMNVFYSQELTTIQKQVGEMDIMFHSPEDIARVTAMWLQRARNRVEGYTASEDDYGWTAI